MEHRNISRLTLTLIGLLGPSAYGHQEESHEHGNLEHCVNFETEETTVHNGHLGAARFTIKNNTCSIGAYITWCWETSGRNGYRFRCDSIARADRRKLTRPDIRRTEARYVLESGGNMEAGPEDTKPDGTAYWFAACAAERKRRRRCATRPPIVG